MVVVMNPDASPGVTVRADVGISSVAMSWLAGELLAAGRPARRHRGLPDRRAGAHGLAAGAVIMAWFLVIVAGLVLLTSLAFAAGALRLARRRVLVQELAAIEGLAGPTCCASTRPAR